MVVYCTSLCIINFIKKLMDGFNNKIIDLNIQRDEYKKKVQELFPWNRDPSRFIVSWSN